MIDAGLITTSAILFVLIFVGTVIIVWVRRWVRRDAAPDIFTVQDLREMRDRGEISAREFEVMRAALLSRMLATDATRPKEPPNEGSAPT